MTNALTFQIVQPFIHVQLVANLYLILLKAHRAQQILDLTCWIFTILVGRNVLFHVVHILGPLG